MLTAVEVKKKRKSTYLWEVKQQTKQKQRKFAYGMKYLYDFTGNHCNKDILAY